MTPPLAKLLDSERLELLHALRTSVAAVASLLVARLFRLPESYWAAITTIVVMQSTLRTTITISRQRLIGTALGAAIGALAAILTGPNAFVFGLCILMGGVICALLHMERNAFRYTGITIAIILLTSHAEEAWIAALHRFAEISLGIVVGLAVTALWPEQEAVSAKPVDA